MNPLSEFIVSYGDIVELGIPVFDPKQHWETLTQHPEWKQYNTYKPGFNRYGLSITSLDGGYSGRPDLESLIEYAKETGDLYREMDFKKRTPLSYQLPEVNHLIEFFGEKNVGRSHFLRLDRGGFFPPHRDHNWGVPNDVFRILVPYYGFYENHMSWIFDGKVIKLLEGYTYFMNTSKMHSLFSYWDNCIMLVLNVRATQEVVDKMARNMRIG